MQTLNAQQYANLKQDATVLEEDALGEKVLHLQDNTIIKLFRRKRLLSSALLTPYSKRFASNAAQLQQLNIPTVTIQMLWRIPSIKRTAVHYRPLEGETVRKLLPAQAKEERSLLIPLLARFIAHLHRLGIYFRSLHPGNIVQTPSGQLGLIDISDMKFYHKPLSSELRLRNFEHFTRGYEEDLVFFSREDRHQFITLYRRAASKLAPEEKTLQPLFNITP